MTGEDATKIYADAYLQTMGRLRPLASQPASIPDLLPRAVALLRSMLDLTNSRAEHAEILAVIAGLERQSE